MKLKKLLLIGGSLIIVPFLFMACGPHHHCGKDMEEHMLKRLDRQVEDLKLNTDQQKKYTDVRAKVATEMRASIKHRKDTMKIMQDELDKENPDLEKAVKAIQEKMKSKPAEMSIYGDHFLEFYAVLNPEQKKALQKDLKEKSKRFRCDDE
jgi:Spy/CpxP family protein refolding chaperone